MDEVEYVVRAEVLAEELCWRLLARAWVGRVGFVHRGEPTVLPVNSGVHDRSVVFRTGDDATLYSLGEGATVAFEVDHTDRVAESGWSVLVHGTLHEVVDDGERTQLADLPVHPWAPGSKDRWMKIVPREVTGRLISRHAVTPDGSHLPRFPPD